MNKEQEIEYHAAREAFSKASDAYWLKYYEEGAESVLPEAEFRAAETRFLVAQVPFDEDLRASEAAERKEIEAEIESGDRCSHCEQTIDW